jgi:acyl-CoA synthetase (AMP-forming)/AMP-acid ligase II
MINLSSFIAFHARRTPGRPALRYRGEDISYASFDRRIRKVGGWQRSQGIGEGDVVAVLMKNSAAFLGLTLATSHIEKLNAAWFAPVMTTATLNCLYLTDRKKDMIISGGENIASSEVERVICELPQVREVTVIGIPDQRWGEKPVAIVVLAEGAALDLSEVADHCRGRLAAFKVPKQLIIRDSLPRNPSGKVLKRVLRAELEADA